MPKSELKIIALTKKQAKRLEPWVYKVGVSISELTREAITFYLVFMNHFNLSFSVDISSNDDEKIPPIKIDDNTYQSKQVSIGICEFHHERINKLRKKFNLKQYEILDLIIDFYLAFLHSMKINESIELKIDYIQMQQNQEIDWTSYYNNKIKVVLNENGDYSE